MGAIADARNPIERHVRAKGVVVILVKGDHCVDESVFGDTAWRRSVFSDTDTFGRIT